MQAYATERGTYNGKRYRVGDLIDLVDGLPTPPWASPVRGKSKPVAAAPPAPEPPRTLSELTRQAEKQRVARAQKKGLPVEILTEE